MALKLATREVGGVAIVDVSGEILWPDGAELLRKEVMALLQGGTNKLVLDLMNVKKVDSGGLGTLVACKVSAAHRGGEVVLLHLTAKMKDLLVVPRLLMVFRVFESEEEAVAALR